MEAVFNAEGEVTAWRDGDEVYTLAGEATAFLDGEIVYSYEDGTVLGWLVDGNYRDLDGDVVAFQSNAQGGPLKPLQQLRPLEPLRALTPLRPLRALEPLRPLFSFEWSSLEWDEWISQ